MEDSICLDSDVLIDFLRNKRGAVEWMNKNKDKSLAITIINLFELYAGAFCLGSGEKLNELDKFISKFKILGLSPSIARRAGEEYARLSSHGELIDNSDLLIGIIALSEGFVLKTNNRKHFERVKGLKIAE